MLPRLLHLPLVDSAAWQLFLAWLFFVVTAGVYHLPATLLGGRCPNSTLACSVAEQFPAVSLSEIGWLPSTFLLVKGLLALPSGWALSRYGPTRCILCGTWLLAFVGAAYAMSGSFWVMPLCYAFFGVAYGLAGLTPLVVFVNSWFDAGRKATSIGLLVTGFATAGMLWPPLAAAVAEAHGWRAAALLLPGATVLIALPIAALMLRDGPHGAAAVVAAPCRAGGGCCGRDALGGGGGTGRGESVRAMRRRQRAEAHVAILDDAAGATVEMEEVDPEFKLEGEVEEDGDGFGAANGVARAAAAGGSAAAASAASCAPLAAAAGGPNHQPSPGISASSPSSAPLSWRCDRAVWHLACMSVWTLYLVNAVQHLLVSFLCSDDVGLPLAAAGLYASLTFTTSLIGKLIFGAALDRPRRRLWALGGCAMLAAGSGLTLRPARSAEGGWRLAAANSHAQLSLFALTFGFGYGAAFVLTQSRAAQLYGRSPDFATLQSFLAVAQCAADRQLRAHTRARCPLRSMVVPCSVRAARRLSLSPPHL